MRWTKEEKQFLIDNIEGKTIKLQVSKPDKYGRYLGTAFLKDSTVSINEQLIKANLAKAYGGDSKVGLWTAEELAKTTIDLKLV